MVSNDILKEIQKAEATMRQREYNYRYRGDLMGIENAEGAFGEVRYPYLYKEAKRGDISQEEAVKYLAKIKSDLKKGVGLFDYEIQGDEVVANPRVNIEANEILLAQLRKYEISYNTDVENYKANAVRTINQADEIITGLKSNRRFTTNYTSINFTKFSDTNDIKAAVRQLSGTYREKSVYERMKNYKDQYITALDKRMTDLGLDLDDKDNELVKYRNRIARMSVDTFATYDAAGLLNPINEWYLEMTQEKLTATFREDFERIKLFKKSGLPMMKLSHKQVKLSKYLKEWANEG